MDRKGRGRVDDAKGRDDETIAIAIDEIKQYICSFQFV
jgi:hypothetical protein